MGRKRLHVESEPNVHGTRRLVRPLYSYWTLGYLLSDRGARKLLEADPFHSFLPVDEYFPILFGQHPRYIYTCVVVHIHVYCDPAYTGTVCMALVNVPSVCVPAWCFGLCGGVLRAAI